MTTVPHDPYTPHPRTVLWMHGGQRAQCLSCANCNRNVVTLSMACRVTPLERKFAYKKLEYCIDARDPGQPCGPEARLFVPAKAPK